MKKRTYLFILFVVASFISCEKKNTPSSAAMFVSGDIYTIAGTGETYYLGDGGPAINADLYLPTGVAVDGSGNIYIADCSNLRIRKFSTVTAISTIAGDGVRGNSGDGGEAIGAELNDAEGVAVDGFGNVYITDGANNRIRTINTSGIITTFAGTGIAGFSGDGGPAPLARINNPLGLASDASGNIYIADWQNNRIRFADNSGLISTIAGNGTIGFSGDGGRATLAEINAPRGVAIDNSGNVYIADTYNQRIRMVNTSGIISTIAGTGVTGFSGDGGPATSAELSTPTGVAVDGSGNVYIADRDNNRIRIINTGGIISTFAGNGTGGYSGDGGPAASAELCSPTGIAVDGSGNVYIADYNNNRIRKVYK